MNIVSLFRSSSTLRAPWEANMTFKKRHMRGMKTNKCKNTVFFLQIVAYERTVNRRILTGIFHSWSALKKIRPMFWSSSAIVTHLVVHISVHTPKNRIL